MDCFIQPHAFLFAITMLSLKQNVNQAREDNYGY